MSTPIQKVLIPSYGDWTHVTVVQSTIPPPPPHHVQIKPLYSGMSGADSLMRLGRYLMQRNPPLTPGYCLVGRVARTGPGCSRFRPGDLIASLTVYGAQAERVNLPEKYLVRVPEPEPEESGPRLDVRQVTALVLDWTTAYAMVHRTARVAKGQRVFIHGLSGAVGNALASLCLLRGAHVYGTASAVNHEALREQGTHPFVYTDERWVDAMKSLGGAHVVFDALGFESWDRSWSILASSSSDDNDSGGGGHLIGYGFIGSWLNGEEPKSDVVALGKLMARKLLCWKHKASFFYISRDQKTFVPDLEMLMEMLREGRIEVRIRREWGGLDEVPEAHRVWSQGKGIGSVVIKVNEDDGE